MRAFLRRFAQQDHVIGDNSDRAPHLTKLFLKEPVFPATFSQLISVGEQTGNLDEMFNSVSAYYEEEFDTAVDNMSSLIEPIMIVFMGTMIGGLMIAMYSPIFNVGSIIGS